MGSVLVLDESGNVRRAYISSQGKFLQKLRRLPGNRFYAIPHTEGSITILCKDGSRQTWGYVTGQIHVRMKVAASHAGCGKLQETE